EMDDLLERKNSEAYSSMTKQEKTTPEHTTQALDELHNARNHERVADHATNIAEDVIFWVRGADVRHGAGSEAPPEPE
ncbi:MAG: PhoU domain-containing protein, partial [Terriglobales bacterium]